MGPFRKTICLLSLIMIWTSFHIIDIDKAEGKDGTFGGGSGSVEDPYIIEDVWDLQNMIGDLTAHYILKNDINASVTRSWNSGEGFISIGTSSTRFNGSLDGKGHVIFGLSINRSISDFIGLFGYVDSGVEIKNIILWDYHVTGRDYVGGLIGFNRGIVRNCSVTGSTIGNNNVGGLLGYNMYSTVSNSSATGSVIGSRSYIGGLAGFNRGTVANCYSTGNVSGKGGYIGGLIGGSIGTVSQCFGTGNVSGIGDQVGGLIGTSSGTVSQCFSTGNVSGIGDHVGGLIGTSSGTISDCYATGDVIGNSEIGGLVGRCFSSTYNCSATGKVKGNEIIIGGLIGLQFDQTVSDCYAAGDVIGKREIGGLVGVNDQGSLTNNFATGDVTGNIWVGGLVGNNRNGVVENCFSTGDVTGTEEMIGGLVGRNGNTLKNCYASGDVIGNSEIGGLVGESLGTVFKCHSTGNVSGTGENIGGLVGYVMGGFVDRSYSSGNVSGTGTFMGGLVGRYGRGISNSHYNAEEVTINGGNHLTRGALFGDQYRDWMSNNLSLRISDYSSTLEPSGGYYNISTVQGLKDLLGFCEIVDHRFRLSEDLDLSNDPGLHIPYFGAFEFNGNGHTISNLHLDLVFSGYVGMFGYNNVGIIRNIGTIDSNVTGHTIVGGLVGYAYEGTLSNCFTTGNVSGNSVVGGLIGSKYMGLSENCYSTVNVKGSEDYVGGLMGYNSGPVSNCYATGIVNGKGEHVGGVVGYLSGTISNCFWDTDTSGLDISDGGTGKTTSEMKTMSTFSDAGWNFVKEWCIIENVTYPLLRWQDRGSPIANAGMDMVVDEGTIVEFVGSESYDDIGIASYVWTLLDEGSITLQGMMTSYQFNNPGSFEITLNVTDAVGNWDTDSILVMVNDITHPLANAGNDVVIDEGSIFIFNGSASADNVAVVNWTWTFIDGSLIVLYGIDPGYRFDTPGVYIVTLNVSDAAGHWATDTMTVTVRDITAPIAVAGSDLTVDEGTVVIFDGKRSHDNVGIVNYTWTFLDGDPIVLYGVDPSYQFKTPGAYEVILNVTDEAGHWSTGSMTVTVRDITAPVAVAGPDLIVDEGSIVFFDGSGSSDNVGIFNYTWIFIDGISIALYGSQAEYQFNDPGVFIVTLNVSDAAGNWATATMTVTVRDITSPVANAGSDQKVAVGTAAILNGSLSTDNVGIVRYTWTFDYDGVERTLEGSPVQFKFEKAGTYEIKLMVFDEYENIGEDTVIITVIDTGIVKGIVLDKDGNPVKGAAVEITSSDGSSHSTMTGENGSFSLMIPHGEFEWKITKNGYRAVSGSGRVDPMGEVELDLSDAPLVKEKGSSLSMIPYLLLAAILILLIAGILLIAWRRGSDKGSSTEE